MPDGSVLIYCYWHVRTVLQPSCDYLQVWLRWETPGPIVCLLQSKTSSPGYLKQGQNHDHHHHLDAAQFLFWKNKINNETIQITKYTPSGTTNYLPWIISLDIIQTRIIHLHVHPRILQLCKVMSEPVHLLRRASTYMTSHYQNK